MLQRLYKKYRYSLILLRELVITDFKLRYQNSVLGYLWALLRPMFLFIILYFVFVHFLHIGRGIPHWPVALLLGIVMWNFFAEITKGGLKAIVSRGGLIRKINFPKYIIIISGTISALINLLFNLAVVGAFMAFNKVELSWTILLTPLFIAEIFIFGLGVAFILSTLYVKFRDIQHVWDIITQGLFYASAIFFPISRVVDTVGQRASELILMNPVAQAIQDARYVAISHDLPTLSSISGNPWLTLIPVSIAVGTFIIGAIYFRSRSPYFAEEV